MSVLRHQPAQRRILYVLDAAAYAAMSGQEIASLERSHALQVVNLLQLQQAEHDDAALRLAANPAATAGALLLQDPFRRDVYLDAAEAERVVALEKAQLLSRVCQCLGARELRFEEFDSDREERRSSASVEGRHGPVRGKAEASSDLEGLREDLMQLNDSYRGSDADPGSARRLVEQHHLVDDVDFHHLIASVEHDRNPLKERTVLVSVNREVVRSLDLLAELGSSVLPSSVMGRYTHSVRQRREIKATYRIRF